MNACKHLGLSLLLLGCMLDATVLLLLLLLLLVLALVLLLRLLQRLQLLQRELLQ
jgi:hypothetical protein